MLPIHANIMWVGNIIFLLFFLWNTPPYTFSSGGELHYTYINLCILCQIEIITC